MKCTPLAAVVVACALTSLGEGRQWKDTSGRFRIEATLVTVKDGKVYLEKDDGKTVSVPLERLSKEDLTYLESLPECRPYFADHPTGPSEAPAASAGSGAARKGPPAKPGEWRRFPKMGWGVQSLAFSPDGKLLAVGKLDKAIWIFDVRRSRRTAMYRNLEGLDQVTCLAFTHDGKQLLSGGHSGRIQVWDVASGGTLTEANRFVGHTGPIHTITIAADDKTVLSGGDDKKLRCWDLPAGRELFSVDGFGNTLRASFISRKGGQGLGCDGDVLTLVDMHAGKVLQSTTLGCHSPQAVAIAPDGSRIAVQDQYSLRMWEIRSGTEYQPLKDRGIPWSAAFLPNSKYLISGGRGTINLWDAKSSQRIHEFDTGTIFYVMALACASDNRFFAAYPSAAGQDLQVFRLPEEVDN
jgi:WD40 repeat protein